MNREGVREKACTPPTETGINVWIESMESKSCTE